VTVRDGASEAVLLVGGYGVVGSQIAAAVRRRHPELPLTIAGRSAEKAARAAEALGVADVGVEGAALDVSRPEPLAGLRPRAVVSVVNDPGDHLLADAMRLGVPLLDIARWTDRVRSAAALVEAAAPTAPVLLSSGWMAGICSTIAAGIARELHRVESIDISVLYALEDKAGPDSAQYMDRLARPFEVTTGGRPARARPLGDGRRVVFPDGGFARVYRFDTPDQLTLPATTGAATVAARIGFDSALTTSLLVALVRSGAWRLISGERFTALRRKLLYNPGPGAGHQVVIEVAGYDIGGRSVKARAGIFDPLGQTHLTAVAALVQLERLLGLDGAPAPEAGLVYPDTSPQLTAALGLLSDLGIEVSLS
jgi:hypothetical protein